VSRTKRGSTWERPFWRYRRSRYRTATGSRAIHHQLADLRVQFAGGFLDLLRNFPTLDFTWGVVRTCVRPPYSKVFELGEAETHRLVGQDKDPSQMVTTEAQRLFGVIREHGSPPNPPLNM
jgi:hypothetical protein